MDQTKIWRREQAGWLAAAGRKSIRSRSSWLIDWTGGPTDRQTEDDDWRRTD